MKRPILRARGLCDSASVLAACLTTTPQFLQLLLTKGVPALDHLVHRSAWPPRRTRRDAVEEYCYYLLFKSFTQPAPRRKSWLDVKILWI